MTRVSNSRVKPVRYTSIKFRIKMIIMNVILNGEMCKLANGLFVLLEPWELPTLTICLFHICLGLPLNWPQT